MVFISIDFSQAALPKKHGAFSRSAGKGLYRIDKRTRIHAKKSAATDWYVRALTDSSDIVSTSSNTRLWSKFRVVSCTVTSAGFFHPAVSQSRDVVRLSTSLTCSNWWCAPILVPHRRSRDSSEGIQSSQRRAINAAKDLSGSIF